MKVRSQVVAVIASTPPAQKGVGSAPAQRGDGTLDAILLRPLQVNGAARTLTVALPAIDLATPVSGHYFLLRCGASSAVARAEQWSFALRQPLFLTTATPAWDKEADKRFLRCELVFPPASAACAGWLAEQPVDAVLNLLGPFGQGFTVSAATRNLLVATDLPHLPLLVALIDQVLDRNGRVALVLRSEANVTDEVRSRLPLPVELRLASDDATWQQGLAETVRWADQMAVALPNAAYPAVAALVRTGRQRSESGFAQALVEADLVCGVGACLACTIPLADGSLTRACVHGPVFDLLVLCGR